MLHVPYKGSAGAITGLLGGEVAFMFNAVHAVLPQVKAGKIKVLAVGGTPFEIVGSTAELYEPGSGG